MPQCIQVLLYARQSLTGPSVVQQLVKYSWCFWVKCEESDARNAEEIPPSYLLEQGFRDANIFYGVVNTRERTEPLNQENGIISPLCYEM